MPDVFPAAIAEMAARDAAVYGPLPFGDYLARNSLTAPTAPSIAVDSLRRLAPSLRDNGIMVFGLGGAPGERGPAFALARCVGGWSDYFFDDRELQNDARDCGIVEPENPHQVELLLATLGPAEPTLLSVAAGSGLLRRALELDDGCAVVPAAGRGRFTFDVRAHEAYPDVWQHRAGPVEIDGVFVGRRGGVETVFVIAARASRQPDSLAKHPLAYAALATLQALPTGSTVVPVYVRALKSAKSVRYLVAECHPVGLGTEPFAIAALRARRAALTTLPLAARNPSLELDFRSSSATRA